MNRALILIFSLLTVASSSADMIPCVKWNPVGMDDIDTILHEGTDEDKSMVHDISGEVTELISDECWKKAEFKSPYSHFGSAKVFLKPRLVSNSLCKSEFVLFGTEEGKWKVTKSIDNYAATTNDSSGCGKKMAKDLVVFTSPIEDSMAEKLLLESGQLYKQYLAKESDSVSGLRLIKMGLFTGRDLHTYYELVYSKGGCTEYNLHFRVNDQGELEYVSHNLLMC